MTPDLAMLETMCLIRSFEEALLTAFQRGELRGTTHTSVGHEAVAVAAMHFVRTCDYVFSNHRCHGHYLAYGGDPVGLLNEIKGLPAGLCKGIGGSQQIQDRRFFSCGLLGGTIPIATGLGLANKRKGEGISIVFLGDGALGEGVVYESFNLAALWRIPVLYIVEHNGIAQSTPTTLALAGSPRARAEAFSIRTWEIESNDIADLLDVFSEAFDHVRTRFEPACVVTHPIRLAPHSKGDDTRSEEELRALAARDPLALARRHFSDEEFAAASKKANAEIKRILAESQKAESMRQTLDGWAIDKRATASSSLGPPPAFSRETTLVEHLRSTFSLLMAERPEIIFLGEDIRDPYGGAFKATKGLSTAFPDRVLTTPVSEAGIVGVANGLALGGFRPVVEIMFGDFITLAADQLINHAAKFRRMYVGKAECPVIVRTPMGGYRGYGPTHSQTLEKLFLGVPGLHVVACTHPMNQRPVWEAMLQSPEPCLYVENKLLYAARTPIYDPATGRLGEFHAAATECSFPTLILRLDGLHGKSDLSILCYGGMAPLALEAAKSLFVEYELIAEVVVFTQLAPVPMPDFELALSRARRVLLLEEGTLRAGWGAELIAAAIDRARATPPRFARCAAMDDIIPTGREQELAMLPSVEKIVALAKEILS